MDAQKFRNRNNKQGYLKHSMHYDSCCLEHMKKFTKKICIVTVQLNVNYCTELQLIESNEVDYTCTKDERREKRAGE